jgi:hypothetical protein
MVKKNDICAAVKRVGICGNALVGNGVQNSGFCVECWNATIVDQHKHYEALRNEGYDKVEAGVEAGLFHASRGKSAVRNNVIAEARAPKYRGIDTSADDLIKPVTNLGWVAPVKETT